jgi:D-glycero-D-manno-heptose 1,7-bisphosphate phosphatase
MKKVVFIDKDGTLIKDIPYNVNPQLISIQDGAALALREWKAFGYLIIVVSNQSGLARGYFTKRQLLMAVDKLKSLLMDEGATIDDFFFCPHHPDGVVQVYATECDCRKPSAGLLIEAAKKWGIDLRQSWMVGDILNDVEAGHRAGCKTILIDNGNETEWRLDSQRTPTFIVRSITEAAERILHEEKTISRYAAS